MNQNLEKIVQQTLAEIQSAGLYKEHRVLESRQGTNVRVNGKEVLNFCANNYLGLSGREELVEYAKNALDKYGYGLSSVRFICGTQTVHKELEKKIAEFLHKDDAIIFTSCWDANEAVFATLLTDADAVISDELNHASIVDGIRLCKAERHVFKHRDLADLEEKLKFTQEKRLRCVVSDGVFSMDGHIAPLKEICDLAEKYNAYVVVDDSHATGFMGETGRGAVEACGVIDRVDLITTTFGKALGGANGGCIAGQKDIIDLFHQRARTTLFTNTVPPVIAATTMFVLDFIEAHPELRAQIWDNTNYFRAKMIVAGFTVPQDVHPIVPVMIGDGKVASDIAREMLAQGIYVIGFSYPVVPMGKARIRVQISAAHTHEQIDQLVATFASLGKKYSLIS
ncbi:MAG: glycine C-acetyltransferase [Candidatus Magasanikbacteria bacterium RIFCSPHIGHO2_01_FULL_41_23]|uniref:8-amino-7-oxononanoate synthase n=1 Tax=Candidatus Magasanikbacteria bacterium RIFCSPLOWO2_01_FULL_40_15 TaxID=1798686 RepID=A0A1F6N4E3_9BACT|nr:MAG: glycine C-acetyltransferase [Candidatus Magasanikbacteria bacterium RIFCSPHIGHO2_01_FULL_41_23]OGH67208.1 MAG: glycine C-acetyltransferase [Candidatus Magasanikbacteria bacterium RIFCSPHIGHO2_02_FULL_41_35]OGH75426.1 MAG: glycine C-acetyltransferase [Candidatus Magasanikbacteria bacterium RIFCSPHIGHO2_12_FULL_41_16]OGH78744.1 MAG: glycine C-acetyltransferase [Candidatus Magasanikbacteria bacterium RIFCSPLOWO2_01_FULL_40_15]